MSAAGEIQAAIDKLLDLREESTPGDWYDLADCVYSDGEWVIGDATNADDTPLIVTLHRTIDAQLAILESSVGGNHDDPALVACATVLAQAINGGN